MFIQTQKYLFVLILLTLAACVPAKSQDLNLHTSTASLIPAYPLDTSYPKPSQQTTTTHVSKPTQPSTPSPSALPSLFPSPIISPTLQPSMNPQIIDFKMFSINVGWAIQIVYNGPSKDYRLIRTTNGLESWTNVTPTSPEGNFIDLSASFLDANTAVVVYDWQSLPTSDKIELNTFQTVDGGRTWQAREKLSSHPGVIERLDLMMLNLERGWLLGIGAPAMGSASLRLFETQRGGLDWGMVYDTSNHISDQNGLWVNNFYPYGDEFFTFITDQTGFFSNGKLFRSQDGGRSWVSRTLEPPPDFPDIDCTNGNCKYLDIVSTPQFTSSKVGMLLRRVYQNSEDVRNSFYFGAQLNQLPQMQFLYSTVDGGKIWIHKPLPVVIGTVYFVDAQTGWLLGKNDPNPTAPTQLYQTINAGDTWTKISADCPLPLGSEIQFVDPQNGFAFFPSTQAEYYQDFDARIQAAEKESTLFYTEDSGRSWTEVAPVITP